MTGLMLAAPALGGAALPSVAARAIVGLRAHPLVAIVAFLVHFAYGSLAGGLFTVGTQSITLRRGVIYAAGMWGLAFTVYAPLAGLGFLASHEPALAVVAIPAHLLYGVALGALAPRGEIVQPIEAPQLVSQQ